MRPALSASCIGPWPRSARCAPGDEVDGVFACTRKDRLVARTGTPYLALELRDRTGALAGARVPRRRRARRALRPRRPRARARARRALPRRAAGRRARRSTRAERRRPGDVPARRLPRPRRARRLPRAPRARGPRPAATRRCSTRLLGDAALRAALAPRAVHARPATTPTSAGCSSTPSRSATLARRDLRAAPAAELRPAAHAPRSCTTSARRASSPTAPRSALTDEGRLLGHVELGLRLIERARRGRRSTTARGSRSRTACSTHHGPDAAPGRRFGSPEALALYRLNALDAAVKGALEHGLNCGTTVRECPTTRRTRRSAPPERGRGARRVVLPRAPELRDAGRLRARRRGPAGHPQHAGDGVLGRGRLQPRRPGRDGDRRSATHRIAGSLVTTTSRSRSCRSPTAACFRAMPRRLRRRDGGLEGSLRFAARRLPPVIVLSFLYVLGSDPGLHRADHPGHLAGGRVVGELPGAAPRRASGRVRGARPLVPRLVKGRLVADVRRAVSVMYLLVAVISVDPGRAAGGDADRRGRQRGGRGGLLHDRQHALVADHAAADGPLVAHRHLLRSARAQRGLRPRAARARRRAGQNAYATSPARRRRGERPRRRAGSHRRSRPPGAAASRLREAPDDATQAPSLTAARAPGGGFQSGDPLADPPPAERRAGDGGAGS